MNAVELAIKQALETQDQDKINKAYLEFLKGNFIVPIEKDSQPDEPRVLFLVDGDRPFLPVFTQQAYLRDWAIDIADQIAVLHLSGVDLVKRVGDQVFIALNPASAIYKEFNPGEIARMRSMVIKFFPDQSIRSTSS